MLRSNSRIDSSKSRDKWQAEGVIDLKSISFSGLGFTVSRHPPFTHGRGRIRMAKIRKTPVVLAQEDNTFLGYISKGPEPRLGHAKSAEDTIDPDPHSTVPGEQPVYRMLSPDRN